MRARTTDDIVRQARPYLQDEIEYDAEAVAKQWKDRPATLRILEATRELLARTSEWTPAALEAASLAGVPAIAVGQHDDAPLRTAAKKAGATRVYAYRALFEHGDRELGAWLRTIERAPASSGTTKEDR